MLLSGAGPGSFPASLTLQDPTFPVGRGIAHACNSPRCKGATAQSACTGNVAICRVRHTPPIQPKHPSGHTHAVPCCRPLRVERAALRRRRWPPLPRRAPDTAGLCGQHHQLGRGGGGAATCGLGALHPGLLHPRLPVGRRLLRRVWRRRRHARHLAVSGQGSPAAVHAGVRCAGHAQSAGATPTATTQQARGLAQQCRVRRARGGVRPPIGASPPAGPPPALQGAAVHGALRGPTARAAGAWPGAPALPAVPGPGVERAWRRPAPRMGRPRRLSQPAAARPAAQRADRPHPRRVGRRRRLPAHRRLPGESQLPGAASTSACTPAAQRLRRPAACSPPPPPPPPLLGGLVRDGGALPAVRLPSCAVAMDAWAWVLPACGCWLVAAAPV